MSAGPGSTPFRRRHGGKAGPSGSADVWRVTAGIGLIGEVAGTGLIRDMLSGHRGEPFRRRLWLLRAESGRTAFGQPRAAQGDPTVNGTVTAKTTLQRTGWRRWHAVA